MGERNYTHHAYLDTECDVSIGTETSSLLAGTMVKTTTCTQQFLYVMDSRTGHHRYVCTQVINVDIDPLPYPNRLP